MKILVIGTGAIGSFYGASLAKAGAEVSLVARSDYDHLIKHGIDIRSETIGDWHFKPHAIYRSAKEAKAAATFDCVMLCVKLTEATDKAALVRDALGPDTAIAIVANGIDIEADLAAAFPQHELISVMTYIYVTRLSPGKIVHQDAGNLMLGGYPQGIPAKAQRLADLFSAAGVPAKTTDNIVAQRWGKSLWNAAFNPISVLSQLKVHDILNVDEKLVRAVMGEIVAVAKALGYPMPPDIIDKKIDYTKERANYKTSMLVDYEAGRPLETEVILGAPMRAGQKAGVPAPHLETIYGLMKMREVYVARDTKKS